MVLCVVSQYWYLPGRLDNGQHWSLNEPWQKEKVALLLGHSMASIPAPMPIVLIDVNSSSYLSTCLFRISHMMDTLWYASVGKTKIFLHLCHSHRSIYMLLPQAFLSLIIQPFSIQKLGEQTSNSPLPMSVCVCVCGYTLAHSSFHLSGITLTELSRWLR